MYFKSVFIYVIFFIGQFVLAHQVSYDLNYLDAVYGNNFKKQFFELVKNEKKCFGYTLKTQNNEIRFESSKCYLSLKCGWDYQSLKVTESSHVNLCVSSQYKFTDCKEGWCMQKNIEKTNSKLFNCNTKIVKESFSVGGRKEVTVTSDCELLSSTEIDCPSGSEARFLDETKKMKLCLFHSDLYAQGKATTSASGQGKP